MFSECSGRGLETHATHSHQKPQSSQMVGKIDRQTNDRKKMWLVCSGLRDSASQEAVASVQSSF